MNKEMQKQQIIKETNEFKNKLVLASKFVDLDVYVGNHETYEELGSIAACVSQLDKPFIYLTDSKILTKYRLNRNEIRGILYHELAHYKLGHTDMDYMIDTEMTIHLYMKQELDADAHAVELAVQDGINVEDALITMAIALSKSAMYIMQESMEHNTLPSQECMEFLQERVSALLDRVIDKDAFMQKINRFKKASQKSITKMANKKGFRSVDDLVDSIQNPIMDEPVYEMLDKIDELLNLIC